jgi:hypothetical protein
MAAVFIAQAINFPLSLGRQLGILPLATTCPVSTNSDTHGRAQVRLESRHQVGASRVPEPDRSIVAKAAQVEGSMLGPPRLLHG